MIDERYVDFEIKGSDQAGLKVPKSAIVEQEYYVIGSDYLTRPENETNRGVQKQIATQGDAQWQFIPLDRTMLVKDEEGNSFYYFRLPSDGSLSEGRYHQAGQWADHANFREKDIKGRVPNQ